MTEKYSSKIQLQLDNVIKWGWNRLDLRNCGLAHIPEEIFESCPELVAIDLSNDDFF